jgi:hypothetical protein
MKSVELFAGFNFDFRPKTQFGPEQAQTASTLATSLHATYSGKRHNGRRVARAWQPCTGDVRPLPCRVSSPSLSRLDSRAPLSALPPHSPRPPRSRSRRDARARAPPPWPPAKLRAATAFPCLRPPFAQMDHRTTSLTSRRTSRAPRLRPLVTGALLSPAVIAPCHRCTWLGHV